MGKPHLRRQENYGIISVIIFQSSRSRLAIALKLDYTAPYPPMDTMFRNFQYRPSSQIEIAAPRLLLLVDRLTKSNVRWQSFDSEFWQSLIYRVNLEDGSPTLVAAT